MRRENSITSIEGFRIFGVNFSIVFDFVNLICPKGEYLVTGQ